MIGPASTTVASSQVDELRDRYLDQLLVPDGRGAWEAVATALAAGVPPRDIYLRVLAPAMERIGELWATARIGVAQEHLATQITQTVLARLAPALDEGARPAVARVAVVGGTPGELHAIGARMVGDFLEGAGWDVLLLGPDTPEAELVTLAIDRRPAVVALSTALPENLPAAERVFAALRHALSGTALLVAGGRAYAGDAQRAARAGADLFADDPEALLAALAGRVA